MLAPLRFLAAVCVVGARGARGTKGGVGSPPGVDGLVCCLMVGQYVYQLPRCFFREAGFFQFRRFRDSPFGGAAAPFVSAPALLFVDVSRAGSVLLTGQQRLVRVAPWKEVVHRLLDAHAALLVLFGLGFRGSCKRCLLPDLPPSFRSWSPVFGYSIPFLKAALPSLLTGRVVHLLPGGGRDGWPRVLPGPPTSRRRSGRCRCSCALVFTLLDGLALFPRVEVWFQDPDRVGVEWVGDLCLLDAAVGSDPLVSCFLDTTLNLRAL